MRLVVNTTPIRPQSTGIGNYSYQLLLRLARLEKFNITGIDYTGIQNHPTDFSEWLDSLRDTPEHKRTLLGSFYPVLRRIPGRFVMARWRLSHQLSRALPAEVYWEPDYLPVYPIPRKNMPAVVPVIHDMAWWRCPQYVHPKMCKQLVRLLPKAVQCSSRLNVVSKFTYQELCQRFNVDPERIDIVSPAAGPEFHPAAFNARLVGKYLLPDNYLISVATLEPRKNLVGLLRAFRLLPKSVRSSCPLLLVGRRGWLDHELNARVEAMQEAGEIRWLGYVPNADLPGLVAGATMMVYPSLYEGFGMPVLEAMACGTPVVTSNLASLPEISGGAAWLVNPNSEESIAAGIQSLLDDATRRDHMRHAGIKRSASYSWESSANALYGSLLKAVGAHG